MTICLKSNLVYNLRTALFHSFTHITGNEKNVPGKEGRKRSLLNKRVPNFVAY